MPVHKKLMIMTGLATEWTNASTAAHVCRMCAKPTRPAKVLPIRVSPSVFQDLEIWRECLKNGTYNNSRTSLVRVGFMADQAASALRIGSPVHVFEGMHDDEPTCSPDNVKRTCEYKVVAVHNVVADGMFLKATLQLGVV